MSNLSNTNSPLYERVEDYVLGNIGSDRWLPDRKLPSENELVLSLGVSRMTVHRALRELTSQGHLLRIQGVGTFVAPPQPQSALAAGYMEQDFSTMTTYDYLQQSTPLTEVEHIISAVTADDETAQRLRIDDGAPCLLMHRRTWTGATVNRFTYAGNRYSLGNRYVLNAVR